MERKTAPKSNTKPIRAYHRPISITVESVRQTPDMKEIPRETQQTINLKGNSETAQKLIDELKRQKKIGDFFAIEITGPA